MSEQRQWPGVGETSVHPTGRWRGVSALVLIAGAGALLYRSPALLLVSGFAMLLTAYRLVVPAPSPKLELGRSVSESNPDAGEPVEVTLTIENTSGEMLFHVSVVDGVPNGVRVVDGSAQLGTALRPGATIELTYTIEAPGGGYEFRPAYVAVRDLGGIVERRTRIEAKATDEVTADAGEESIVSIPFRQQVTHQVGQFPSTDRGDGIAFETVREYQHGDPISRIDWRQMAKTGELRTIEFQQDRSLSVAIIVDARATATVVPDAHADARTAVEQSTRAAATLFEALEAENHRIGVGGLAADPCWIAPSQGERHRARVRETLATDSAFAATADESDLDPAVWLRAHIDSVTQVFLITPLADQTIAEAALKLEAGGTAVTVISPSPAPAEPASPGQHLATLERETRIAELLGHGIPTYQYDPIDNEDLASALLDATVSGATASETIAGGRS